MPADSHEQKLSLMMGLVEQSEQIQCAYTVLLHKAQLTVSMGEMQLRDAKKLLAQA